MVHWIDLPPRKIGRKSKHGSTKHRGNVLPTGSLRSRSLLSAIRPQCSVLVTNERRDCRRICLLFVFNLIIEQPLKTRFRFGQLTGSCQSAVLSPTFPIPEFHLFSFLLLTVPTHDPNHHHRVVPDHTHNPDSDSPSVRDFTLSDCRHHIQPNRSTNLLTSYHVHTLHRR